MYILFLWGSDDFYMYLPILFIYMYYFPELFIMAVKYLLYFYDNSIYKKWRQFK